MKELTFKEIIDNLDRTYTKEEVIVAYKNSLITRNNIKDIDKYEYPVRDLNEIYPEKQMKIMDCFDSIQDNVCSLIYFEVKKIPGDGKIYEYEYKFELVLKRINISE